MKLKFFDSFDLKSLKFKLWAYFLGFAVLLIAIVWLAQVYFLNNSYESMKAKQVGGYAQEIIKGYSSEEGLSTGYIYEVQKVALESGADIIFEDSSGNIQMINSSGDNLASFPGQHPIYSYEKERSEIRQRLENGGNFSGYSARKLGGSNDYKVLIYGTYLEPSSEDSIILYMFTPLYPVASTISILKSQLFMITIIALVLAFWIAFYLSYRVTKPLKKMRKSAELLSQGQYGIQFTGGHYSEFIGLGDSLSYMSTELAKSDQLQKDIIANVSHDLRTPLTMIRSYAEMIRDLSGDIPEKRNRHLEVIVEETDRLNQLVDDMFTLSKMQAGVTAVTMAPFDISEAAKEIYHSYEILCIKDGYTILFNNPPSIEINGDEARIKQVISNLLNNAVKYCGDDKFISLDVLETENTVTVTVTDHGKGIPEDELSHVWDRYYRVSSNYHRSKKGTGLGLSICKEILLKHNAKYGVESTLDKGSTFWFTLDK